MALPPLDFIEFETKLNLVADDDKPAASKPKPKKTSPPPKQQPSSSPSSPNLRARSRDPTGYIQTANTAQAIDCMSYGAPLVGPIPGLMRPSAQAFWDRRIANEPLPPGYVEPPRAFYLEPPAYTGADIPANRGKWQPNASLGRYRRDMSSGNGQLDFDVRRSVLRSAAGVPPLATSLSSGALPDLTQLSLPRTLSNSLSRSSRGFAPSPPDSSWVQRNQSKSSRGTLGMGSPLRLTSSSSGSSFGSAAGSPTSVRTVRLQARRETRLESRGSFESACGGLEDNSPIRPRFASPLIKD